MFFVGTIRKYLMGIVIGLAVGLWLGVNIGKDQPLYSNPLNTESLADEAKRKAGDILEHTKKSLREQLKGEADSRL